MENYDGGFWLFVLVPVLFAQPNIYGTTIYVANVKFEKCELEKLKSLSFSARMGRKTMRKAWSAPPRNAKT